jgi:hypothetical protein
MLISLGLLNNTWASLRKGEKDYQVRASPPWEIWVLGERMGYTQRIWEMP